MTDRLLLRFGIPDFKLDKSVIDRRIEVLIAEGIEFKTNVEIGVDIDALTLKSQYDAVVLCGGAAVRRGLTIPGAQLNGVVQAMDFLKGNNKSVSGELNNPPISAKGKHVIVIGGGDTGSDCIGTSIRHGALSVSNFEIMPQGTPERPAHQPWPFYPMRLKTSTSHKEGAERFFSISTKEFTGDAQGNLTGLKTVQVAWEQINGSMVLKEVPGSEKIAAGKLGALGVEPPPPVPPIELATDFVFLVADKTADIIPIALAA